VVSYQADEFADGSGTFTKFNEAPGGLKRCIRNHFGERIPPLDFHKRRAG
jgi:hypothetical protein